MPPSPSVERLLAELFTPAELRRWLRRRDAESDRLVDALPSEPVEPAELAHQATRALFRFGMVNAAFWDDLVRERPLQAAQIRAAQAAWGAEQVARWPRLMAAAVAVALAIAALWFLGRAPFDMAIQHAEPTAAVDGGLPSAVPSEQSLLATPAALYPKPTPESEAQADGNTNTKTPTATRATQDEPAPPPSSTATTTEVKETKVDAGRDANILGDHVTVEKSEVQAKQDVTIGGGAK